jgi:hypothetical protein
MTGRFSGQASTAGLAALVLTVLTTQPAQAIRVEIVASNDNTLIEDSAGSLSNGVGPSLFAGRTGQPASAPPCWPSIWESFPQRRRSTASSW